MMHCVFRKCCLCHSSISHIITPPYTTPHHAHVTPLYRLYVRGSHFSVPRAFPHPYPSPSTPCPPHLTLHTSFPPIRHWLVTSSKDRTCRVWDLRTRQCREVGEGHSDAVGAVCVSQRLATYQSKIAFVVTGSADKVIKRWALPTHAWEGKAAKGLAPAPGSAPGSGTGTGASVESTILGLPPVAFAQQSLVMTHGIRAHDKDINTLVASPNDALIASGSQDKTIRLWRSTDLSAVGSLIGHKRGVWKVAFSPVDRCLASSSADRTVRLWSMADYSCLRVFEGTID